MTLLLDDAQNVLADQLLSMYLQHADSARAVARSVLLDPGEAEDVVQEVFLSLWRRPDCFDPVRGSSRAWFLTVVRNRSVDHLRRRAPRGVVDDLSDQLADAHATDIVDVVADRARAEELWRLVDTLPASQSDVIRRAFVRGQTHQQIADATGLPLGTVKSRVRLGLGKLRCSLAATLLAEFTGQNATAAAPATRTRPVRSKSPQVALG